MWAIGWVAIFVVANVALGVYTRAQAFRIESDNVMDYLQPLHVIVCLYCAVNILINLWEIALFLYIKRIQSTYIGYKKKLEQGRLPSPLFLFQHISLGTAASFEFWHDVWATYSLLDVSYAQEGSFGYNIDVCNGFSTIIPSLLFIISSCNPKNVLGASPRTFGFVSALFFYQAMYGTFVYLFQYVMNKRWLDHQTPAWQIVALVFGTNVFWIIGPIFGLYASYKMVIDDNVKVLY
jgi:hypothetical protein